MSSVYTNLKPIHDHIHKSPHVNPILRQTNPVYTVCRTVKTLIWILPFHLRRLYVSRHFECMYHAGKLQRFKILLRLVYICSNRLCCHYI